MKPRHFLAAAAAAVALLASPLGAQGGRIGTLDQGAYVCALPGDAAGSALTEQPGMAFTIASASSYRTASGGGTYLLEGRTVVFTRGPLKGTRLKLVGTGLLQRMEKDGRLGRVRCHRAGPAAD